MVDHVEDSVNAIEVGENPYAELENNIESLKMQGIGELYTSLEAKISKYIEDEGLRDRILSNAARVLSDAQAYEKNPDSVPELEYARNSLINANILMDLTGILVDRAEGKDGGVVGNEAVKGGHFAIKDGGGLFNLLKKLEFLERNQGIALITRTVKLTLVLLPSYKEGLASMILKIQRRS